MDTNSIEKKLIDVMTAKGAEPFWVNSAMEHIRKLLTGNTFFTLSIKDIKVTVKGKHVA